MKPTAVVSAALSLLLLGSAARADLLVGRVVDANGVGIAGVDLDFKNNGSGGNPNVSQDFTDALGFFSTTVPAGNYDVTFNPPPPPASSSLVFELENVSVVGTRDLGTLVAPQGVAYTGRLLRAGGIPVAGVNLDVIDLATGDNLDLIGDTSNAAGEFGVAVPIGAVEVRFDATPVLSPQLASTFVQFEAQAGVPVDAGDLLLAAGHRITALVRRPNGTPLAGADTDTEDTVTGVTLYTPKDNTSATGVVSVVVPAGVYDFRVCPALSTNLVAHEVSNLVVNADVNLGVITLQAGVRLSGTVTAAGGGAVSGVDLDVRDSTTLAPVALCDDNTNAAGVYAVNVPVGDYLVRFSPPASQPYGAFETNVTVSGTTLLNASLPDCPFNTHYGTGLAGAGGIVPTLDTFGGAPRVGNDAWGIQLADGRGGAKPYFVLGFGAAAAPFKQGTWLVDIFGLPGKLFLGLPPLSGPTGVAGAGQLSVPVPIPDDASLVGLALYSQLFVQDDLAPSGFALSAGMQFTFCD